MVGEAQRRRDVSDLATAVRRRRVPARAFGTKLIVARPRDGAPVVLEATAAVVWRRTEDWTTLLEIVADLGEAFPGVEEEERRTAAREILRQLEDDDLIERA
jgi:hypothetical protein